MKDQTRRQVEDERENMMNVGVETAREPGRVRGCRIVERIARVVMMVWLGLAVLTFVLLAFTGIPPYGTTARGLGVISAVAAAALLLMVTFRGGQRIEDWLPVGGKALAGMVAIGVTFTSAFALAGGALFGPVWGVYGLYFLLPGLVCTPIATVCAAVVDTHNRERAAEAAKQLREEEEARLGRLEAKVDQLLAQQARRRSGLLARLFRRR